MSSRAPIGYLAINRVPATTNQGCKSIVPNSSVITEYLYYYLTQNIDDVKRLGSGSTFAEVGKSAVESVEILLPPITEQKKIAEILSTADEEIRKTDEIISAAEKLKNGLMQELFTKGIGHTKFKKTKMGMIPVEWEVEELRSHIKSLDAGVSVNSFDRQIQNGEIGILKTSAVTFGVFDAAQHKVVIEEENDRVSVPVKGNRVIVSRMNTPSLVGANAYVKKDYPNLYLPDRLWQVEPRNEKQISMEWLGYLFNLLWKNGTLSGLASGTSASMKNLSKDSLLSIQAAFSGVEEQTEIAKILSSVDEKILLNKELLNKFTFLKKGLMQDLLSGDIRVK